MAIYSCNLKSIGRTTHSEGTAGAHIRYIARPDARPALLAENIPHDPQEARNWIDRAERASRKNARMLDKIRIALPRELDEVERAALVEAYMADLTGGRRVPWYAAIHQTGKDARNPHVHIAVHDRDMATGKRVLRLSDSTRDRIKAGLPGPKAVDWIRERWEIICNRSLEQAGHEVRVDRRTLEAQGIDRQPTIHEGPRAQHINDNVERPKSKSVTNGAGRVIDYPAIDKGRTRCEFNAHIIDLNLERAIRSGKPEAAAWAQFEREQAAADRALEKQLAQEQHTRTKEQRGVSRKYTAQHRRVRAERKLELRRTQKEIQGKFRKRREAMRARQGKERRALRKKQKGFIARIARRLSRNVRAQHVAVRKAMVDRHYAERYNLSHNYQQAKQEARDALIARYSVQYEEIEAQRSAHLAAVQEQHCQAEEHADLLRQQREADREHQYWMTERKIADWKKRHRQQRTSPGGDEFRQATKGPQKSDAIARATSKVKEKEEEERQRGSADRGRERRR